MNQVDILVGQRLAEGGVRGHRPEPFGRGDGLVGTPGDHGRDGAAGGADRAGVDITHEPGTDDH
jgi:hypothetical protein